MSYLETELNSIGILERKVLSHYELIRTHFISVKYNTTIKIIHEGSHNGLIS